MLAAVDSAKLAEKHVQEEAVGHDEEVVAFALLVFLHLLLLIIAVVTVAVGARMTSLCVIVHARAELAEKANGAIFDLAVSLAALGAKV